MVPSQCPVLNQEQRREIAHLTLTKEQICLPRTTYDGQVLERKCGVENTVLALKQYHQYCKDVKEAR